MRNPSPVRRLTTALAAVLAVLAAPAAAQEADAAGLELFVNHAKIVKLAEPAATVVIGNDSIADATVKDATTLVLTGRAFGSTNLVILDAEGEPIVDERLIVRKDEGQTVRVFRPGENDVQFSEVFCAPVCAIAPSIQQGGGNQPGNQLP